jgi:hypothetical protein
VATTPPAPAAVAHVDVVAPAGPSEAPWYKDPLGDGLTAGGVVAIGVGIGFLVMASSSESAAQHAMLRNDFLRDLDDATTKRRVGAFAITAGAALAAGGVYVYWKHDRHSRIVGTTDGRSISIAGRF